VSSVEAYSRLAGVYDEIVVDPCFSRWAAFLHELWSMDHAGVTSVLDLCCGTGLMDAELARLGYRVVGVDASRAMLDRAAVLLGPDAVLLEQTLPDLVVDGVFDAAISTFDGLNYLTDADFRLTVERLAARVRPGGWFVFDLHTDAMLALASARAVLEGDDHGYHFSITNDVDLEGRTCDSRIEVTRGDDTFIELHRQYFHHDEQVLAALHSSGFDSVMRTDEYTHATAGPQTLRATWIARRAG
jgi:SAM-dependent methyltransferase